MGAWLILFRTSIILELVQVCFEITKGLVLSQAEKETLKEERKIIKEKILTSLPPSIRDSATHSS